MPAFSDIANRVVVSGFDGTSLLNQYNNNAIKAIFQAAFEGSPSLAAAVMLWLQRPENTGKSITVNYVASSGRDSPGFANPSAGEVFLTPDRCDDFLYISETGRAVPFSVLSVLVHEIGHAVTGLFDAPTYANLKGNNIAQFANDWFSELGISTEAGYLSRALIADSILVSGKEYTEGKFIRNAIVDPGGSILGPVDVVNPDFAGNGVSGPALFVGSALSNTVTGTIGADYIYGGGGDDFLKGAAGSDKIFGEDGADYLEGGDGNDDIDGGKGGDQLFGDGGSDKILGGEGGDVVDGGFGDDQLYGGDGDDDVSGGPQVSGSGSDNDKIWGGAGNDRLEGGAGEDEIHGDDGNDILFADEKDVILDGGNGIDSVDYSQSGRAVNWSSVSAQITDIELVIGSDYDDSFELPSNVIFPDTAIEIRGGKGRDTIRGNDAVNTLGGGEGADNIWGGSDNDLLYGGDGDDNIEGGDATYILRSDQDIIFGGAGNDTIDGGADDDTIEGGEGNDRVLGGRGADTIDGGLGDDILVGGYDADVIRGGAGSDILDSAQEDGPSGLPGSTSPDRLWGGSGADRFLTNDGDVIYDVSLEDLAVIFEGQALRGGHMEEADSTAGNARGARPETGTYIGSDGEKYSYSQATGTLTVSRGILGTSTLEIKNFRNGAGGINLTVDSEAEDEISESSERSDQRRYRDPRLFFLAPISPLVIDLNGNGVSVSSLNNSSTHFDMDMDGMAERTAWVQNGDGLLALDRNSDGVISDISELFGSPLENGFDALRVFDLNLDGVLTASDSVFAELRVWIDANQDGVSQQPELRLLASLAIVSISVTNVAVSEINNGNAVTNRGVVGFADGHTTDIDDVWFKVDQVDAIADLPSDFAFDPLQGALPELRGTGSVADLSITMAQSATLRDFVANAVIGAGTATAQGFRSTVESLLRQWTKTEAVSATSRGAYANAQHLAVIEALYGQGYQQKLGVNAGTTSPGPNAAKEIELLYQEIVDETVTRFGAQVFRSQLALSDLGLIDAETAVSDDNAFARIASFIFDIASDQIITTNFEHTVATVASGLKSSDDASLNRFALLMSVLRGAKSALFDNDGAAYETAVRAGLQALGDKALIEYGMVLARGANLIAGTAAAETVDSLDPANSALLRRLDGISSILMGGGGNDTLAGRLGGDAYVFRVGDGQDLIRDLGAFDDQTALPATYEAIAKGLYRGNAGGTDRLLLPGIAKADLSFSTVGSNLVIRIANHPNDVITIQNYFDPSQVGYIEEIIASDAVIKLADISTSYVVSPTTGDANQNILAGTSGNDILDAKGGNDTFTFGIGSGQDTIIAASDWASTSDTVRVLASADQTLMARIGNDLVIRIYQTVTNPDGSTSRMLTNDKLTVKDQYEVGVDIGISFTYGFVDFVRFTSGESYVVTSVTGSAASLRDAVLLPFNRTEATFSRTSLATGGFGRGRDLQIKRNGVNYSTVAGEFNTAGSGSFANTRPTDFNDDGRGASVFVFADGSYLSRKELAALAPLVGTAAADELIGSAFGETINGGAGDDKIKGYDGDDIITGGAGNDIVQGDSNPTDREPTSAGTPLQAMTFTRRRATANYLYAGNDTYIYRAGDGNDVIIDQGQGALDSDTLKLVDLNPNDVTITRIRVATPASNDALASFGTTNQFTTTDLLITVRSTGQTVRVWDQFFDDKQGIEKIEFADGTVFERDYILATAAVILDERGGSELAAIGVVDGGTAYQYVRGFGSTDTVLFGASNRSQTAYSFETVRLKNLNSDTVRFSRDGLDLIIKAGDAGPELRVAGHFAFQPVLDYLGNSVAPSLKSVIFANGETWDRATIFASSGIDGGIGQDSLTGTVEADLLRGFGGDDHLAAGDGDDTLVGGAGNDVLDGGSGADRFVADDGDGNDEIAGGDGFDFLDASATTSAVDVNLAAGLSIGATTGTDSLAFVEGVVGGVGDDHLTGDDSANVLNGGLGNDELHGGGGDDTLIGGAGSDFIDGGTGLDTASYGLSRAGVGLSLDVGAGSAGDALGDSFVSIENIVGSNYSDTIQSNAVANRLDLGGGNDTAHAGGGDDIVTGGSGTDKIWGDAGNDVLTGDDGSDQLFGGDGDDAISGGLGTDFLDGGKGSDIYTWRLGDGNDEINDVPGADLGFDILRVVGLSPATLRVETNGAALFLIAQTGEQITINQQISGASGEGVEKVVFDDATEWNRQTLSAMAGFRPNRAPYAISDAGLTTTQGSALSIAPAALLINDFDPDGDSLSVVGVSTGSEGTAVLRPDGSIRFTPASGFLGRASFTYTVRDAFGSEASATAFVDVTEGTVLFGVQDDLLASINEDEGLVIESAALLLNDMGTDLHVTAVATGVGGAAELRADGTIGFTASTDYNGVGSFSYTVADGSGNEATANVRFGIAAINDAPLLALAPIDPTSPEDGAISFALPAGTFTDIDLDPLTLTASLTDGSPLPAWLAFDGATFRGTPPGNFNGSVAIRVTAADASLSANGTFRLVIDPVNDAPVLVTALADVHSFEDTPVSIAIPANAFADVDGNALTYSARLAGGAPLPQWLALANGVLSGTLPTNFNGALDIEILASDGQLVASDVFRLTIDPVNDAPVLALAPIDRTGTEDTSLSFTLPAGTFTDVDGDALTLSATLTNGDPLPAWLAFASGTFSGTPPADFNGTLSLRVAASDGQLSATADFALTISPVNDAPLLARMLDDVTTLEDSTIAFALPANSFTDVDGDALTLSAALGSGQALPTWLLFDAASRTFAGTPPVNFNGELDITVSVADNQFAASDTFRLTVSPVNDAPVLAVPLADKHTAEDAAVVFAIPVGTFTDVDFDPLSLTASLADGSPLPGWLTFDGATFRGTPPANFNGSVAIRVTAADASLSANGTFRLVIDPVNDAPVLVTPLADVRSAEDTALSIPIPANAFSDVDGTPLSYSARLAGGAGLPGWLTLAGGVITGTPPANFNGVLDIEILASDSQLIVSDVFRLTIDPVNDAPVVSQPLPDMVVAEDHAFDLPVSTTGFTDPDGNALSFTARLADGSPLPTWLQFANDRLSGTPPLNYNGALDIALTASDGSLAATDVFRLTVLAVNDAPTLVRLLPDMTSPEDGAVNLAIDKTAFGDVDGDLLTFTARRADGTALPSWLTFDGTRFTGQPPANFNGNLDLEVFASDGLLAASDTIRLTISPVNDAPVVAVLLADVSSPEDTAVSFTLPAGSFSDVDGNVLSYGAALTGGGALPAWLTFNATTRGFSGTPPVNYNGFVDVRVTASDGTLTAFDDFRLTITPVNDAPVAVNDSGFSVAAGSALTVQATALLANDSDPEGSALSITGVGGAVGGTVALNAQGQIVYTATSGFAGAGSFTYTVSDGALTSTATVAVQVTNSVNTINGTSGADILNGLANVANLINGLAGNDIINGGNLNDTLNGGLGSDVISGGAGNDTIDGGDDGDVLNGDAGNDTLIGGAGGDTMAGGIGDDTLDGGADNDVMNGGDGNDILLGGAGADVMSGGVGNDTLSGGDGADVINGDDGNDVVSGGAGNDTMTGGAGIDTIDYSYATTAVTINLATSAGATTGESDVISGFENATGGSGNDTIAGTSTDNVLSGGAGDDKLTGGLGNDTLNGGTGIDTAVFAGVSTSYSINTVNGVLRVIDNAPTTDGNDGSDAISGIEKLLFKNNVTVNVTSPIILDLDGNGVTTVSAADSDAKYDLDGDGLADDTSWIGNTEGFLFLDRDKNGTVTNAGEFSFIDDVPGAASDLAGLKAFDSNKDGKLSSSDERFADFRVWRDADGDGAVDTGEVLTLTAAGVASIGLTGIAVEATTKLGEVAVLNRGSYTRTNGATMQFIDAALTYFSAALNLPAFDTQEQSFERKEKKYRITVSGGTMVLAPKKSQGMLDPGAGRLGANVTLSFAGKTYGMLGAIVLDLDGNGIDLKKRSKSAAGFDMNGDGATDDTGWASARDGLLVIDRNGDGAITDASELSLAAEDAKATSAIEGLARLDSNGDGMIDAKDARFAELRVWVDANGNGVSDAGELRTLEEAGITAIGLRATAAPDQTLRAGQNAVLSTVSFTRANGSTGTAGNVAFGYKPGSEPAAGRLGTKGGGSSLPQDIGPDDFGVGPAGGLSIDPQIQSAIQTLGYGSADRSLSIFDLPSDSAAFDRFAMGEMAPLVTLPAPQASIGIPAQVNQAMPASLRAFDVSLPFDAGLDTMGDEVDVAKKLALLRQDMAGFGARGAFERLQGAGVGQFEFFA